MKTSTDNQQATFAEFVRERVKKKNEVAEALRQGNKRVLGQKHKQLAQPVPAS